MSCIKLIYILIPILFYSNQTEAQNNSPNRITIHDFSIDGYTGKFEYYYELNLTENNYELTQFSLYETDFKKEKKKTKSKVLGTISKQYISELIDEINRKKDSLSIKDLGYDYKWFNVNLEEIFNLSRKL